MFKVREKAVPTISRVRWSCCYKEHLKVLMGLELYPTSSHNQYFPKIKKRGIELVEIQVQNKHNNQKHLKRFLAKSEENIKKAKDFLDYLAYCNRNRKRKN